VGRGCLAASCVLDFNVEHFDFHEARYELDARVLCVIHTGVFLSITTRIPRSRSTCRVRNSADESRKQRMPHALRRPTAPRPTAGHAVRPAARVPHFLARDNATTDARRRIISRSRSKIHESVSPVCWRHSPRFIDGPRDTFSLERPHTVSVLQRTLSRTDRCDSERHNALASDCRLQVAALSRIDTGQCLKYVTSHVSCFVVVTCALDRLSKARASPKNASFA
jgi:hypothetical protein